MPLQLGHLLRTWKKVQIARRKMLRYVFRIHRRKVSEDEASAEDCVAVVRDAAHGVEAMAACLGMHGWAVSYERMK